MKKLTPKNNHFKKAFSLIELSIVLLIIGIIIVGITQSSLLFSKFRLSVARSTTESSPVTSISNLFLWLDTTSANSFDESATGDGEYVSNWYDLNPASTVKRNFTSADPYLPIYIANAINNLPALRFDGIDDYMISNTIASNEMLPNNTVTMFFVAKIATSATATMPFTFQLDADNRCLPIFDAGVVRFDCPDGTGDGLLEGVTDISNTLQIITLFKNETTQTIYLNGASDATQANALPMASFSSEMLIGSDGESLATSMDVGEIIIFSRGLKTEERQAVESYLSHKWKINLSS